MEIVDYRQFASPLSEESPAGADLEYNADFLKIIDLLNPPGVTMVASEDDTLPDQTDWNGVVSLCEGVAAQTRDVRVVVRLARSVVQSQLGIMGFAGAVELTADLIVSMWDDVHPVLDVDDDMDAIMRFNALNELGDAQLIKALRMAPIAVLGRESLSLHDIEVSIGKAQAGSADEQSMASGRVADVFAAANQDKIVTAKAVVDRALVGIEKIRAAWSEKMDALSQSRSAEGLGFENIPAPQFEALTRVLSDISRHILDRMPEMEVLSEGDEVVADKPKAAGVITTRADADKAILNVVEWFRRNEPSSPVPIMLERARSMISKSFLEIVEGLGEGGIAEARKAAGPVSVEE